jgi:hypothetical protein
MLYIQHTHTHTHISIFLAGRLLCFALRREPGRRLLFWGGCFWMDGESIVSESSGGCCTVVDVCSQLVLIDSFCIYTHHTQTQHCWQPHTGAKHQDIRTTTAMTTSLERGCLSVTSPNVSNLLRIKAGDTNLLNKPKEKKKTRKTKTIGSTNQRNKQPNELCGAVRWGWNLCIFRNIFILAIWLTSAADTHPLDPAKPKKWKIKTGFSRMQSSTVYICLDICACNNEGRAGGFCCFISHEKNLNKNKTGESITTGDVCNENKWTDKGENQVMCIGTIEMKFPKLINK